MSKPKDEPNYNHISPREDYAFEGQNGRMSPEEKEEERSEHLHGYFGFFVRIDYPPFGVILVWSEKMTDQQRLKLLMECERDSRRTAPHNEYSGDLLRHIRESIRIVKSRLTCKISEL